MIRRNGTFTVQVRENMRGGKGRVQVEEFWAPQKELRAKTRLFSRLTLAPGCSIGFHEHVNEEEVYVVLRGRGMIDEGGVRSEVGPGDTILTGSGAGHAVETVGTEPLELLAVIVQY